MNRNIPCERVEPDLTGYLLGALPAAREAELRTHLETCERCRASAKELADTLDLLRGALAASPDTPAALSPDRRAKVLTTRRPVIVEAWHTWMYPVARAALLLLVPGVLLSALLLPFMFGGRASAPILGKLSDAPAADAYFDHGTLGAAPAPAAPVPTEAPVVSRAGQAEGGGRWDTGGADWGMRPASGAVSFEKLAEATPADKSAPATEMNFSHAVEMGRDSRGTVSRRLGAVRGDEVTVAGQAATASAVDRAPQRVTLTGGQQIEGVVRQRGNGEIEVTTAAGSSMRILSSQLAANDAIAPAKPVSGPAPAAEEEYRERLTGSSVAGAKTRTAAPADPFGGEPAKQNADPFAYSDSDSDRDALAERPAGGPGLAAGGYQAGMSGGGGGGPVAGLKYGTTPPAGSVSEVRKRLTGDRSELSLDDALAVTAPAETAPAAAGKEDAAKEVYVPLRPTLPKPMFVGTPVPAKAPNLEAAGTRQTYDLPAAVADGRAVILASPEPAAATAPTAAPATPPAPPPPMAAQPPGAVPASARRPVPALGDVPVLGSVFKREEAGEATRESPDVAAKGKADARYYYARGAAVAGKDVADQNGRMPGEAAAKSDDWGEHEKTLTGESDETVLVKGLVASRTAGGRASELKALTKSGSGTLDLSGANTYVGGTMVGGGVIINGGATTLGNTLAAPVSVVVAPPASTAPAQTAAGVPVTPGDSQVAQQIDRLQVADGSVRESRDADKKQKSETDYALGFLAAAADTARPAAEGEKRLKELQDLRTDAADAENKPVDELRRVDAKVASEPATQPKFTAAGFNPLVDAKENAFSTFSIDVDTASYAMARRAILEGRRPEPESVRTEEFVNSFDYDYAPPASGTFAVHIEGAPSPFRKQFDLLKIGVKAQRIGRDGHRGAVLTFVVDTSGSMNTEDRLGLIRTSLRMLVERLAPDDLVAIVTFNNRASLALEPTPAAQKDAILAAVANLETAGSTQLEGGLRLGYEVAARAFRSGASNRVILMSDGVANLGAADSEAILRAVEEHRKQGIYCTVLGFGTGTYDDTMLESLANKGDGTYVYIDSIDEAKRVLVDEMAATLHTVARDVKIQVEFNPERVKRWRQLGYENRKLEKEQFRDDTVDAGEVGSGQSVTALYDVELQGRPELPVATVRVRYRNLETGAVEEIEQRVVARHFSRDFAAASPRFRLAAGVAEFAELLRMSPYTFSGGRDFNDVAAVIRPVALELRLDERVRELARLVQAAPSLPGS